MTSQRKSEKALNSKQRSAELKVASRPHENV